MLNLWDYDVATGMECGINQRGVLYLGNKYTGFNLPDTPENRKIIIRDYERYTGRKILKGEVDTDG